MGRSQEIAQLKQNRHMQKQLIKWLGPLTTSQKELIHKWSLKSNSNHKLMAQARSDWQKTFDDTLLNKRDHSDFEQRVQTLLVYPEKLWSEEYQQSVTLNQKTTIELFVNLSHTLNQKQKNKLQKKLRGYISDFHYLAKN